MNDFEKYAVKHVGIPSSDLHRFSSHVEGNLTPYILEERKMNVTQMDVFSRLMGERIIWVTGVVNSNMSSIVSAQLMYLDSIDKKDITLQISSPGGSVVEGLTTVDVMNYISSDVSTVNMGMAASMGSILLGNGTKGKRFALPNARVMIHQVSSSQSGHISDQEIGLAETKKYNEELFKMLGQYTGKSPATLLKKANRDWWLNATESKELGIIDDIITKKK